MLRPSSEAKVAEAQRILKSKFKAPTSEIKNVSASVSLETTSLLHYRGKVYRVPAVGWKDGLQLQRFYMQLQTMSVAEDESIEDLDLSMDRLRELETLMLTVHKFFKRLCRPAGIMARLTWYWKYPFEDATQQELGELLGFFFACRTKSSVRLIDPSNQSANRSRSTSTMN